MKKTVEGTIKELTNIDGMSKQEIFTFESSMKEALQEKILIGVSLKANQKIKNC
jgi:hypothetical protein